MTMQHRNFTMGGEFDLERYRPMLERQANMRAIHARMIDVARANQPGERFWFVLETFANCEKSVEKSLSQAGVESYLPTVNGGQRRIRHRMVDCLPTPALPGYMLVCILPEPAAFVSVGHMKHVAGFVGGMANPHRVSANDVNRFKALLGDFNADGDQPDRFAVGDLVRFAEGLFIGFYATILKIRRVNVVRGGPKVAIEGTVEIKVGDQTKVITTPLAFLDKA